MQVTLSTLHSLERGPGPGAGDSRGSEQRRPTTYLFCTGIIHDIKSAMRLTYAGPLTLMTLKLAGFPHLRPCRSGFFPFRCACCTVHHREEVGRKEAGKGGGEERTTGCVALKIWVRGKPSSDTFTFLPKATFAAPREKADLLQWTLW